MPQVLYAKVNKDVNVAKVQAMLAELCYEPGIVDGAWGKKTETAVKAFFAKHYRKYDGNFDVSDANFILSAGASAKVFGSASVKKCLVVYSTRIGDSLKNAKIKQITQKVANKKKKSNKIHYFDNKNEIPDGINWQPNDATLSHYYTQTARIVHRS
jgi:peptidoglycan hydrolase-like protein with peptidoglycan-binding domain